VVASRGLGDGEVAVLVRHEAALIHVPGQDPVQRLRAGQGRRTVQVRMGAVQTMKPEEQGFDVADDVFDVVLHEGQQPQPAARERLRLDGRRIDRLAQGASVVVAGCEDDDLWFRDDIDETVLVVNAP